MDRKLKGIPVYAIVLILVSGTALGAGIWFLTVDVPVDYDEPVEITMYDERQYTDVPDAAYQYGGTDADFRFRDRHTHEVDGDADTDADMTYETFHQHIEFDNPGEQKEIRVSIQAYDAAGDVTTDIGLVWVADEYEAGGTTYSISHPVQPEEVTWNYDEGDPSADRVSAELLDPEQIDPIDVEDSLERDITVETDTPIEFTVIYSLRLDDTGDPIDVTDYTIEWQFEDITDADL